MIEYRLKGKNSQAESLYDALDGVIHDILYELGDDVPKQKRPHAVSYIVARITMGAYSMLDETLQDAEKASKEFLMARMQTCGENLTERVGRDGSKVSETMSKLEDKLLTPKKLFTLRE